VERTLLAVEAFDPEFKALGSRLPPGGPRAFVVLQSREGAGAGMRLIESLRRAGIRAEGGLFASSLKAQMREANRCGAAFCAILGEEELKSEPPCCTLKSMADGTQRKVELGRLAEALS
jgi:histidyl-tRNA synthetase